MAKKISLLLGIIFVVIGILGFFQHPILLGYFAVNNMHNLVHILTGIIFLIASMGHTHSISMIFKVFGVIYLLIAILGFIQRSSGAILGIIAVNGADNWLHVVLGVVILGLGFFIGKVNTTVPPTETPAAM